MKRRNKKSRHKAQWLRESDWLIDFKIRSRYGGIKYEEKELDLKRGIRRLLQFNRFQGSVGMDMAKLSLALIWMALITLSILEGKQLENYNAFFLNTYCPNGPGGLTFINGKLLTGVCPVGTYTPSSLAAGSYGDLPVIQLMKRKEDMMLLYFSASWAFILPLFGITAAEKLKRRSVANKVSHRKEHQSASYNQ